MSDIVTLREPPTRLRAFVVNDATGALTVVPAPGDGFKIAIWGFTLTAATSVTITFKSGANALTGPMTFTSLLQVLPVGREAYPVFETNMNETFNITLGSAVQLSGVIYYEVVPT